MSNKTYGAVIVRVQTPYLTNGHKFLFDEVLKLHEEFIVFIGVHKSQPTERNCMDFITRKVMVEQSYPNAIVLPSHDHNYDEFWSKSIDKLLSGFGEVANTIIYGSRDSCLPFYSGEHKTVFIESNIPDSASEIRAQVAKKTITTQEGREGIIHAIYNRIPSPYLVMDVAVINDDKKEVLAGRKEGETKYRWVGGYADSLLDADITSAAHRETIEEIGKVELADFEMVGNFHIDDWRYRNDKEKVFSIFFKCKYIFGHIVPSDDLPYLEWIPIDKLAETEFIHEHEPLKLALIENLKKEKQLNDDMEELKQLREWKELYTK